MLNVKKLLTKVLKGVYASGADGIWTYRKYADGTYHAWWIGGINLLSGTALAGGYFHKSGSELSPPSFSNSVTSLYGAANGAQLYAYIGHSATFETYWWNGVSAGANNVLVRLDMYGTW